MTAIIALQHAGFMHMAADGRVTDDSGYYMSIDHPKIFKRKNYLIGICGDGIASDLVEAARLPEYTDSTVDTYTWLIRELAPSIRSAFREANYSVDTEKDSDYGALITINGDIFEMDEVLAVSGPLRSAFHALGDGAPYCIGVLSVTEKFSPRYRLRTALEVASLNCASVGPPFTYLKMGF